jgi:hypothetical protein
MGLNFLSKNDLAVKGNSYVGYLFQFIGLKVFGKQKEIRWATREKEIKANAKNRKKASKHQRRNGSKKKKKRNRFEQMGDKHKAKR